MNTESTSSTDPVPLDYGRAPPRRRRVIRRMVLAICIMGASLAAWRWGPAARDRVQLLYAQRQCLVYSPSPDLVVYEANAAAAKSLLLQPHYIAPHLMRITGVNNHGAALPIEPSIAAHRPAIFDDFLGLAGIVHPPSMGRPSLTAVCFMGELRTPSGKRRLVIVECHSIRHGRDGSDVGGISGISIAPGTAFSDPGDYVQSGITWGLGETMAAEPSNLRIFAGQRDPKNRSRFTIRYQIYGQEGVVDGSVDDAGVVNLMPLPPLPQPSSRRSGYPYR